MADIKFLAGLDIDGNIDLNKGQLQAAVIHPLASNPSSPSVGQLYYNTGDDELKVYTSGGWIAVGADTDNYVNGGSFSGDTLTLTRTGSLGDIDISGFLEIGSSSSQAMAGNTRTITSGEITKLGHISVTQAVDLDTMESDISSNKGNIATNTSNISTNASGISTNAADISTNTSNISTNTSSISTNTSNISTNTSNISSNSSSISTNTSNISTNATNITTNADDIADLQTDVSTNTSNISTNASAITGKVAKAGDTMTGFLTLHAKPTADLHAATKSYVDDNITGQLIYQGGYDASAAPPSGTSVKKGFTYTVTTAGDGNGFFTTELEIGDLIIAESDNPSDEDDWTEVNKNVDLATTSTVGVASFSSSNFAVSSSGEVTVKNNGIALGTETTGSYVESLVQGTNVTITNNSGEGATPTIAVANSAIDARITNRQYAGLIGGGTAVSIASGTHGLGSDASQFMIQLIEVSSGETVQAEVVRGSSGTVTVKFTTAPSANAIRILINKIG